MDARFTKSDAGRDEIKSRSHALSRPARNLLLIIDASRAATDWMQLVYGATENDLRQLMAAGLVTAAQASAGAVPARAATLAEALARLSHEQVYSLLTSQAKDRLGLIRGFKMILDVEKCANADELRALALRFFDQVQAHQGERAARAMRMALGVA